MYAHRTFKIAAIALLLFAPSVFADSLTGPLTAGDLVDLTDGATYGPQTAVQAHEPDDENGPYTFDSGDLVPLYGTNSADGIEALLFVLTALDADVLDHDPITSVASFDTALFGGFGIVEFLQSDFYAHGDTGFPIKPDNIAGINGDSVNGMRFYDGVHAAALVEWSDITTWSAGTNAGSVIVSTDVNLRVDMFGVDILPDGSVKIIVDNNSNSSAFGVRPDDPDTHIPEIPEPATVSLLLMGLVGMSWRKFSNGF